MRSIIRFVGSPDCLIVCDIDWIKEDQGCREKIFFVGGETGARDCRSQGLARPFGYAVQASDGLGLSQKR